MLRLVHPDGTHTNLNKAETGESVTTASLPDSGALDFNRRGQARLMTEGWAQIFCLDPYKTFLCGAAEIVDTSDAGLGLLSDKPIPLGEVVEVRFAPFRTSGRIGTVLRCQRVEGWKVDGTPVVRYRLGVRYSSRQAA